MYKIKMKKLYYVFYIKIITLNLNIYIKRTWSIIITLIIINDTLVIRINFSLKK